MQVTTMTPIAIISAWAEKHHFTLFSARNPPIQEQSSFGTHKLQGSNQLKSGPRSHPGIQLIMLLPLYLRKSTSLFLLEASVMISYCQLSVTTVAFSELMPQRSHPAKHPLPKMQLRYEPQQCMNITIIHSPPRGARKGL